MNSNNDIWVFLSHSYKDFEKVRTLRNLLEDNGFRPIMLYLRSKEDPSKVEELRQLIYDEIDHRSRFIYCKSPNAETSTWVADEVKYIKGKDRIFETINIELSESEIKEQLDGFRRKSNIFISYQCDDVELATSIANRLRKYEFHVWIDFSDLRAGVDFQKEITDALLEAVNNGYVITLLNEKIFNLQGWTRAELMLALQNGDYPERSIIPVVQDHALLDKIGKDVELKSLHAINTIDSSVVEPTSRCDYIVDKVIERVLPPGAILSHAQNFESGYYGYTDIEEAKKLYAICFKIAERQEKSGSPVGDGVLGYCYEHGYGTEQNFGLAVDYYREAARTFPKYDDDYRRLSQQLYGDEFVRNRNSGGLWGTIKRIWTKIVR